MIPDDWLDLSVGEGDVPLVNGKAGVVPDCPEDDVAPLGVNDAETAEVEFRVGRSKRSAAIEDNVLREHDSMKQRGLSPDGQRKKNIYLAHNSDLGSPRRLHKVKLGQPARQNFKARIRDQGAEGTH